MAFEIRKLSDVCRLINGRAYRKHEMLAEGKYPLLRVGNFFSNRAWYYSDLELDEDKYCDNGDLLYAWSASFGPRIWGGDKVIYHYHIWKIELNEELVDKGYLFHLLDWDTEQIKAEQGTGSTMIHVTKGAMESRCLPFPPIPEQKRIVAILDQAFADIEQARAKTEQNLKNARELFESYLQQVFSQRGEGWDKDSLSNLGRITSSKRIFKREYVDTGVPFYRTKEIKQLANIEQITTELFISKDRYDEIKEGYGVPLEGDILLTAIGTIGEIYVVSNNEPFYFKDGNVLWLKEFDELDSEFLRYALQAFVVELQRLSKGAAYNALPIQKLKSYEISYPNIDRQRAIVTKLDELMDASRKLESIYKQKLDSLDELKKSILQKAFTGELTKGKGAAA